MPNQTQLRSDIEDLVSSIKKRTQSPERKKSGSESGPLNADEGLKMEESNWRQTCKLQDGNDGKVSVSSLQFNKVGGGEKYALPFKEYLSITQNVDLGSGDEDSEMAALTQIAKALSKLGTVPIPEDFDIIPDTHGYLLMQGTDELYSILQPSYRLIAKGAQKRVMSLQSFKDLLLKPQQLTTLALTL